MVDDSDRRPTAQEIEELIDLVRRDPSSPAFIDLGEAYLALGRPKDAISVGNMGLEQSPDNNEGRVMLARAFCALHQWKEAQGELLRVVKVDRSNRRGFALLGEVLLRRNDYERAVPVLQHAQNLDPTSPALLSMLKRARSGQPLDAPPPIPTPMPPRGETNYALQLEKPTRAPAMPVPALPRPGGRSAQVAAQPAPVPIAPPAAPTLAISPAPADPPPWNGSAASSGRGPKQTAPPPMSVEGVRPRVISTAKPQNAAAASLRQSAAVGENYLNDLLTGGLLDVAGVRVPDAEYDLRPDRRWGRSTRRAFIFLFVVLVLGIGGSGFWYYWSERQKAEAVARLQKEAKTAIALGDYAGFETSLHKLADEKDGALQKDPNNLLTISYVAETAGLETLLYGTDSDLADNPIKRLESDLKKIKVGDKDIVDPDQPGARELVIAKAALDLSRLPALEAPATTLAEVSRTLDDYLAKNPTDKWARWLEARALLAAGERTKAKAILKQAADGDDGIVPAILDQADLAVDDGALDDAFALYDKVLTKAKDHPLAVLGKSLARAESSVQASDAIDDLNVKLDKKLGARVAAYRDLALSLADAGIEDYPKSGELVKKSVAYMPFKTWDVSKAPIWPAEPRFLARVAWVHYLRGDFKHASTERFQIKWYGKSHPEDEPEVMLVDAGLALAEGSPEKALDITSKLEGVRPRILRAYAELDLGKAKDALADMDAVLKKAPDNLEAQILRAEAAMISADAKDRSAAADALEKLARRAKSKIGRHALGMAYVAVGDAKDAQPQLEQAVADLGDEAPNPLAYRTRTALAKILFDAGDLDNAKKQLDLAFQANSGYTPMLVLGAKVSVKAGDPKHALDLLQPLFKDNSGVSVTPDAQLVLAEALCAQPGATVQDKADAKTQLEQIKDKYTPKEELGRVAALCDPKLPEELGVPVPPDAGKGAATPPKHHHR
ncbi:MAG TPA: tetratricopeptide repeat protein [Kofleriaceae bacterium]|jgi:tetratricopeptide (TPR) repeat protein